MDRRALRIWIDGHMCGCGQPELALGALLRLLELAPYYDHQAELAAFIPDDGVRQLVLYGLDRDDLLEHGGSVGGAWLSDFGEEVLAALRAERDTEFEAVTGNYCVHGYDPSDPSDFAGHQCW